MNGPRDGWAYSPVELAEIWELPAPSATDIGLARTPIFEFHRHASTEADARAVHLITQDTIAQLFDKEPPGLLKYDAPFEAMPDDRYTGIAVEDDGA